MSEYNILAGCLDWTESILNERLQGTWTHARTPDQLYAAMVDMGLPQFVFFPHWRWKVPKWLLDRTTCIGFHMGDLPHGRGGSPIQWRILEGKTEATITAYRMTEVMDWGPVYSKRKVWLDGSLRVIFERTALEISAMIGHVMGLVADGFAPVSLEGDPTDYPALPRREPEESNLRAALGMGRDLSTIYDRIRMVDHPDYPRAFIVVGAYILEFSNARLEDGRLIAKVDFCEHPGFCGTS